MQPDCLTVTDKSPVVSAQFIFESQGNRNLCKCCPGPWGRTAGAGGSGLDRTRYQQRSVPARAGTGGTEEEAESLRAPSRAGGPGARRGTGAGTALLGQRKKRCRAGLTRDLPACPVAALAFRVFAAAVSHPARVRVWHKSLYGGVRRPERGWLGIRRRNTKEIPRSACGARIGTDSFPAPLDLPEQTPSQR